MTETKLRNAMAIVSADWLAANLNDPKLRIYDCTTILGPSSDPSKPYEVQDGGADYAKGHIPGAAYLDLQGKFSDQDSAFGMTLPDLQTLTQAFADHGVSDDSHVVIYCRNAPPWATRFLWMLHAIGFDNASFLDGGLKGWIAAGHPIAKGVESYPPGSLTTTPRPQAFVGREDMLAGINAPTTCTINALGADVHSGQNDKYGRAGRIPGSVNAPAASLFDPETMLLRPLGEIAEKLEATGARPNQRILAYCGGGIFATLDAFLLYQLGYDQVSVYDNSLSEWAKDPSLPIEVD